MDNNTFENDYILAILRSMVTELNFSNKNQAQIMDKYAVELTAYMNGKQADLRSQLPTH